jgi:hypothetical protein
MIECHSEGVLPQKDDRENLDDLLYKMIEIATSFSRRTRNDK